MSDEHVRGPEAIERLQRRLTGGALEPQPLRVRKKLRGHAGRQRFAGRPLLSLTLSRLAGSRGLDNAQSGFGRDARFRAESAERARQGYRDFVNVVHLIVPALSLLAHHFFAYLAEPRRRPAFYGGA